MAQKKMLSTDDVDDTPVNGVTTEPVSSNWAYDHNADLDAHTRNLWETVATGRYILCPYGRTYNRAVLANYLYGVIFPLARDMTFDRIAIHVQTAVSDYTAGTATFSNGSDQVVGDGTTFAAGHVGRKIKLNADTTWHWIGSVEDTTHLTLTAVYSDTGGAGAYTIRTYARLGIYNVGTNLYPGTLVQDSGEVAVNATGFQAITGIDQSLTKGLYFTALVCPATPTLYALEGSCSPLGSNASFLNANAIMWRKSFTYAALPDPFTAAGATYYHEGYQIGLRVESLD